MRSSSATFTVGIALALAAAGCEAGPDGPVGPDAIQAGGESMGRHGPAVVSVAADHHDFVTSADEISSGWTTFRFTNRSHAPHFMIIEKMPVFEGEQKTVEDSEAEVVPVFQNFMDSFRSEPLTFPDAGFALPAWYGEVVFVGGPGLTSPGETSQVTVHLEPGTYVIECYVKTGDGVFHSTKGMIRGLTVNGTSNGASEPPRSSVRVTVSSGGGISMDGDVDRPGRHTFEVEFADQTVYSHFLGHDVHLVRLDSGADLGALGSWMNWVVPGGLASPAPGDVTFLGGSQDMPGGSTAYITAHLPSGDYAWIAEVPDPDGKDMLVEFSVP